VAILDNSLCIVNNSQFIDNIGSVNVLTSGGGGGGAIFMNDV
jgi:hypothetical protein